MSFQSSLGVLYSGLHWERLCFSAFDGIPQSSPQNQFSKYEHSPGLSLFWCVSRFLCWNSSCVSWSVALPFNYVLSLPQFLYRCCPLTPPFLTSLFFLTVKQARRIENPTPSHDASPFASFNPFHPVGVWKLLGWVFLHKTWGLNLSSL